MLRFDPGSEKFEVIPCPASMLRCGRFWAGLGRFGGLRVGRSLWRWLGRGESGGFRTTLLGPAWAVFFTLACLVVR